MFGEKKEVVSDAEHSTVSESPPSVLLISLDLKIDDRLDTDALDFSLCLLAEIRTALGDNCAEDVFVPPVPIVGLAPDLLGRIRQIFVHKLDETLQIRQIRLAFRGTYRRESAQIC